MYAAGDSEADAVLWVAVWVLLIYKKREGKERKGKGREGKEREGKEGKERTGRRKKKEWRGKGEGESELQRCCCSLCDVMMMMIK